jgi:hypothetical protein
MGKKEMIIEKLKAIKQHNDAIDFHSGAIKELIQHIKDIEDFEGDIETYTVPPDPPPGPPGGGG